MQKAWGCWEGRAGSPAAGQCRVLERGADKQFEEQTQRFVLVTLCLLPHLAFLQRMTREFALTHLLLWALPPRTLENQL